ncbi:MAG: DUF1573 domain-containing protein, partial [Chitinophagales bacterium]
KMKKILLLTLVSLIGLGLSAQSKPAKGKKAAAAEAKVVTVAPISNEPSIFIEKETVDYGVIDKGADGVRTFKVTNRGAQPLLLTNCSGSCGCTVPTCPREPILPGKSAEVQVKYDTGRPGPINKQVNITSNDPQNPNKVVFIRGEVKDAPAAN